MSQSQLSALAEKYGTDKLGHYTPIYDLILKARHYSTEVVFEIGIHKGASLRMWRDYFPFAEVYGMDVQEGTLFSEERIQTFAGNQQSNRDLARAVEIIGKPIDLIIDDASHETGDQIGTFQILWPHVRAHGLYIIEDVNWQEGVSDRIGVENTVISHRHSATEIGKCIVIQKPDSN